MNIGESGDIVERFVTRSGLTFPILLDPDEASLRGFGTISLPSSFLIDRQGNMRARWIRSDVRTRARRSHPTRARQLGGL